MDPPEHTRHRALMNPAFTTTFMAVYLPLMQRIITERALGHLGPAQRNRPDGRSARDHVRRGSGRAGRNADRAAGGLVARALLHPAAGWSAGRRCGLAAVHP